MLVPDGDVAALAETLDRVMSDDGLRTSLGPAGREAIRRFTPEAIVEQWLNLAEEVLGERTAIAQQSRRHVA